MYYVDNRVELGSSLNFDDNLPPRIGSTPHGLEKAPMKLIRNQTTLKLSRRVLSLLSFLDLLKQLLPVIVALGFFILGLTGIHNSLGLLDSRLVG